MINRRDWLQRIAGGVLAGGMRLRRGSAASLPFERPAPLENPAGGCPLALKDYQPKSMLASHGGDPCIPRALSSD